MADLLTEAMLNRPWQIKVADRAIDALAKGKIVIIDSPTGSGKTLILLKIALARIQLGQKGYVAVRTVNELSPYSRDINRFLRGKFSYTYLLGKSRTCPWFEKMDNGSDVLCRHCLGDDEQRTLTGSRRKVDGLAIKKEIDAGSTFADLQKKYVVKDLNPPDNLCLYFSLKARQNADLTLLTYPYVISPVVRKSVGIEESTLEHSFLFIDEAHSLENATSMFEQEVQLDDIYRAKTQILAMMNEGFVPPHVDVQMAKAIPGTLDGLASLFHKYLDTPGPAHKDKAAFRNDLTELDEKLLAEDIQAGFYNLRRYSEEIGNLRTYMQKLRSSARIVDPLFDIVVVP